MKQSKNGVLIKFSWLNGLHKSTDYFFSCKHLKRAIAPSRFLTYPQACVRVFCAARHINYKAAIAISKLHVQLGFSCCFLRINYTLVSTVWCVNQQQSCGLINISLKYFAEIPVPCHYPEFNCGPRSDSSFPIALFMNSFTKCGFICPICLLSATHMCPFRRFSKLTDRRSRAFVHSVHVYHEYVKRAFMSLQ